MCTDCNSNILFKFQFILTNRRTNTNRGIILEWGKYFNYLLAQHLVSPGLGSNTQRRKYQLVYISLFMLTCRNITGKIISNEQHSYDANMEATFREPLFPIYFRSQKQIQ